MASTLINQFYKWEKETPHQLFLRQPIDGKWHNYTYSQAGADIRKMATALRALKLPAESNIAILSKNCAHWIMADLAIMMAGYVSVPIYPTLSAHAIQHILEHSQSKAIFLGKLDDYSKQKDGVPDSIIKISFPIYGPNEGIAWSELVKNNIAMMDQVVAPDAVATIMYSSGTTGTPKGVMLTYKAYDFFGTEAKENFGIHKPENFFSYLPLSHIAEKAYIETSVFYTGSSISFTESLDKFAQNLQEVQPVLFGGVPRIYAKLQEGVLSKLSQTKLDFLFAIPGVSGIIKKTIRKKIGLNNAKVVVCGSAPIPVSLLKWYKKLGINIWEIYGMTENCGYSHGDHGQEFHFGTVGRHWPKVEAKISSEGEILIKHGALMKGYYKDPETTASVFTEDGFLKTGDKGTIDADGFLTITGRMKDQFKTDKGKFIAPAPIEMKLLKNEDIDQVCVVGMGIPQPIALVVLSVLGKAKSRSTISAELAAQLEEVNAELEPYEKLKKVVVVHSDWTIENGLLSPTLKVKRYEVEKIHLPNYPLWYKERETVLWE